MKSKNLLFLMLLLIVGATLGLAFAESDPSVTDTPPPMASSDMTPEEGFDKMMAVLTHKRCVNCHPSDDHPRQGEDSHVHNFGVRRGPDNHGVSALKCNTCHQPENNNLAGVPGAPEWSLAPLKMAWQGLTRVEIAKSMMNPDNNGGRSLEELVHHLTEHELVLWAWEPGVDANGVAREKPPVSKEEYIAAVKAWAEGGAPIPEK